MQLKSKEKQSIEGSGDHCLALIICSKDVWMCTFDHGSSPVYAPLPGGEIPEFGIEHKEHDANQSMKMHAK